MQGQSPNSHHSSCTECDTIAVTNNGVRILTETLMLFCISIISNYLLFQLSLLEDGICAFLWNHKTIDSA